MVEGPGAQAKTTLSLSYKLVNYLTVSAELVKTFVASNRCIFTVYRCAILKTEVLDEEKSGKYYKRRKVKEP